MLFVVLHVFLACYLCCLLVVILLFHSQQLSGNKAQQKTNDERDEAEVREVRDDAIIATGRSDYDNQVNNVMGFPYIFRGALDVRATAINEEMKLAAAQALAAEGRVRSEGGTPARSMERKAVRASAGRSFWAREEMRADQAGAEGRGEGEDGVEAP